MAVKKNKIPITSLEPRNWWDHRLKKNDPRVGKYLANAVDNIRQQHEKRLASWREITAKYRDSAPADFEGDSWINSSSLMNDDNVRSATFNVMKSSLDTIAAKITQRDVDPHCSTYGGDSDLHYKADGLKKLVLGVKQHNKGHILAANCFRDSGIYPVSWCKVYSVGEEIKLKRIHPSRMMVDELACLDDEPTSLYQVENQDRDYLANKYPHAVKAIRNSRTGSKYGNASLFPSSATDTNRIEVIEAWHLRQGNTPGRRVISLGSGEIIADEPWDDPFPFVIGRWDDDVLGFYGQSLCEQLVNVQDRIDCLSDYIQRTQETNAALIFAHRGSIVDKELLSNDINRVVWCEPGHPLPQRYAPASVNPQDIQLLDKAIDWGYELAGVSQLSATSKQPKNFESGAAIRTYLDVETVRHAKSAIIWENWHVDMFERIVECARRTAAQHPNWSITYLDDDRQMNSIKWSQVSLKKNQFQFITQPISALPQHAAARLERVMEMRRDQMITTEEFRHLSKVTDLEEFNSLKMASMNYSRLIFEQMLEPDGEYIPPEDGQPQLSDAIILCNQYRYRELHDKLRKGERESEGADRLLRWMTEAVELVKKNAMEMAPVQQQQPPVQQQLPVTQG